MTTSEMVKFLENQQPHIQKIAWENLRPEAQYHWLVDITDQENEEILHVPEIETGKISYVRSESRILHIESVSTRSMGYFFSVDEIMRAKTGQEELKTDRIKEAMRQMEKAINGIVLDGNIKKGWHSLISDESVTVLPASNGNNARAWETKTPEEILEDIENLIEGKDPQWRKSNEESKPNRLLLPYEAHKHIQRLGHPDKKSGPIANYISRKYTDPFTHKPLEIITVDRLKNITNTQRGRAVAYRKDPKVLRLHLIKNYEFSSPQRDEKGNCRISGSFRTGGLYIRKPEEIRYLDEII